ncbi:hypothetical protein ACOJR9_16710 [Alteromonas sp. A081]
MWEHQAELHRYSKGYCLHSLPTALLILLIRL